MEETGYPRNDLLSCPDAPVIREQVRKSLAVGPDTTVVLYAPTWRDDEAFAPGTQETELALDTAAVSERFGQDVALLVRSHYLVSGRGVLDRLPGVTDVSCHPDIRELYLAADVLVTDYSSVMFDFSVTGKPIVFSAYDLVRFRDSVRGFYFDFVRDAPAPVVQETQGVLEAVADLEGVQERYAEAYAAFRTTYCALEDGRAGERVLALLGL